MPTVTTHVTSVAHLCLLLLFALLAGTPASAQDDPAPPEGGFDVIQDFDQKVNLDDGYVTMMDAQYPNATPPASGWPVILKVHGLGGSRLSGRIEGELFASFGYFFFAIDVRGQGTLRHDPRNAGMGTTLVGVQERRDIKTHVDNIAALYPGIADTSRLGIKGSSQGGAHSWAAAAWSGKLADATDPGFGMFPVFAASTPKNLGPYRDLLSAPEGQAVRWRSAVRNLFPSNSVVLDPAYHALMTDLVTNEDFEALYALATDPNVNPGAHIIESTVPVLCSHAHQDYWTTSEPLIRAFQELGSGNAKRLILSTGGHGTPSNVSENDLRDGRVRAWFDRFLKERETGVLVGNRLEYNIIPSDPAVHDDPYSRWDRRSLEDWPPPNANPIRLYLKANGRIRLNEPGPTEPDLVINQTVTPGYDMRDAVRDMLDPVILESHVPEQILSYETGAVNKPVTLTGNPSAYVSVTMIGDQVQLTLRLLDVPPTGEPRFITAYHWAKRFEPGDTPPDFIDVELPGIAWRLETGHRLRVEISNLTFFNCSLTRELWVVPYFSDFSVTIHHAEGNSSYIEVPRIPDVMADAKLWVDRYDLSAGAGAFINATFTTDTDYAGFDYLVLGSASGTTPGFIEDGLPIWLNPDGLYHRLETDPNSGPFDNMTGSLDTNGEAFPVVDLLTGLPSKWIGLELSLAGRVLDGGTVVATSNPVTITVMP